MIFQKSMVHILSMDIIISHIIMTAMVMGKKHLKIKMNPKKINPIIRLRKKRSSYAYRFSQPHTSGN